MKLLIHASGYTVVPPWANDRQEISCTLDTKCGGIANCHWSPANRDFAAAGVRSGGSTGAGTVKELLDVIAKQAVESIEELRILGHANDKVFSLAGDVKRDDVYFSNDQAWIGPFPAFESAIPQFKELQDRFTADAKIILMGCNAGSGNTDVMKVVSHAFLRTVQGFKNKIHFNFEWGPTGATVRDRGGQPICTGMAPNSSILLRGRMAYVTVNLNDPLADTSDKPPPITAFTTNAWNLQPDSSNNEGDIFIAVRRTDAGSAATELAWRIMTEFFPGHAWVAGTGINDKSPGLTVIKDGTKMMIDIKPAWGKTTTPATLKKRVAEMRQALELVKNQKTGSIAMT
ncbi:hypothetical protein [Reyranella sp. CPCC 100927]|uniref:hypothetical protein n=1 Tax=Reyranella sp. CPCC 100927 TaxID=2599616 RepID=UPI0011B7864B|nr:hypothetical protein [Reyranella sp. CPCC 100927]TWT13736.1 hypothetical protein FQU96_07420 [Reyranella sp. CPCC 100927]